jgi:MoaA/NifB/PqqE/SkfB family radical SAM enzyme
MQTPGETLSRPRLLVARLRRLRLAVRARRLDRSSGSLVRRLGLMLQTSCGLRCRMCDLWLEAPASFPESRLDELLSSRSLAPDAGIHFTGGEPFLYPDFARVYSRIRARFPRSTMSIHSGGYPAAPVKDFLGSKPDLRRTWLFFSYDGPGVHDRQRGREGAEAELLSLVAHARSEAPRASIALGFTVTPWNAGAIRPAFERAKALGVGIQYRMVEDLPEYTNSVRRPREGPLFAWPDGALAAVASDLRWVFNRLSPLAERHELGQLLGVIEGLSRPSAGACDRPCAVPSQSAFIRADGAVLTCRSRPPVGNALEEGLDAAMSSEAAEVLRRDGCGACEPRFSAF